MTQHVYKVGDRVVLKPEFAKVGGNEDFLDSTIVEVLSHSLRIQNKSGHFGIVYPHEILPRYRFRVGDIVDWTVTDTSWQGSKIIKQTDLEGEPAYDVDWSNGGSLHAGILLDSEVKAHTPVQKIPSKIVVFLDEAGKEAVGLLVHEQTLTIGSALVGGCLILPLNATKLVWVDQVNVVQTVEGPAQQLAEIKYAVRLIEDVFLKPNFNDKESGYIVEDLLNLIKEIANGKD